MAIETISTQNATFRAKAKAGSAELVETGCIKGAVEVDLSGEKNVEEIKCFSGPKYLRGTATYGQGNLETVLDGANADEFQALMVQADKGTGDFTSDDTVYMEIEFANSKGTNGTKLSFEFKVKSMKVSVSPDGAVGLNISYQQTSEVTIAAAA